MSSFHSLNRLLRPRAGRLPAREALARAALGACALALFSVGDSRPARAHEPGTIVVTLAKAAVSGPFSFLTDTKGKGDTRLDYAFRNNDPDVDVILVFPVCAFEGDDRRSFMPEAFRVANLDAVLAGTETPVAVKLDPQWGLCQLTKAELPGVYLLRRGQTLLLQMALDIQRGAASANGKLALHSYFDIFAIDPEQTDSLAQALLASSRPKAGLIASYLKRISSGRRGDARQWFSLFYRLTPNTTNPDIGTFNRTTWEDLYLPTSLALDPAEGTGIDTGEIVSHPDFDWAVGDYKTPKAVIPDSGLIHDPQHSSVRTIDPTSAGPSGDEVCEEPRGDCARFPSACLPGGGSITRGASVNPPAGLATTSAATYTITGQFSVKWTDHALHPGWGWRAVAWWNDSGSWTKLASEWVEWDGHYTLSVNHAGYSGQNLRVQFRAYNSFFEPRTSTDDLFRWRNPDRTGISTSHDEGHWYADADGGDANGLGELYFGGYMLWSEMYWRGELNPLRADPLKVYYPNSTYDCGDGSGVPWSCASCDGRVWLTAAHGVQNDIVQHEFAHQVHYEFWNNNFPSGACVSHSFCTAYTEGLALTEGYADFVPAWVGCSRGDASCTASYGTEMETDACAKTSSKNSREWYVAQTFHDLWDSHTDGDDVLWYVDEGSTHKIFLGNGLGAGGCCGNGAGATSRGMDDFQTTYNTNCSAGHAGYIDDIFDQNLN